MNISVQILFISAFYVRGFIHLRVILYGIKRYVLNNSAYKKRKKCENILEWFTYSRWRNVIPKFFIIFYFAIVVIHPTLLILCVILNKLGLDYFYGEFIVYVTVLFDSLWIIAFSIFSKKDYFGLIRRRGMEKESS